MVKDSSASHTDLVTRLSGTRSGEETDRKADPNCWKAYLIAYDIMLTWKLEGESWTEVTAWELTEHESVDEEQLHCVSLVLYILIILSLLSFFSVLLNCNYLNSQILLFFFLSIFLTQLEWGSEWDTVWCLVACLVKPW